MLSLASFLGAQLAARHLMPQQSQFPSMPQRPSFPSIPSMPSMPPVTRGASTGARIVSPGVGGVRTPRAPVSFGGGGGGFMPGEIASGAASARNLIGQGFVNNLGPRSVGPFYGPTGGKRYVAMMMDGKPIFYAGPKVKRWENGRPVIEPRRRDRDETAPVAAPPVAAADQQQAAGPDLFTQLQQQQDLANAENERRYAEGMGMLNQNRENMLGALDTEGARLLSLARPNLNPGLSRERQYRDEQLGGLSADMAARGLYPTTIGAALERGIRDDSRRREEEIHDSGRQAELAMRQYLLGTRLNTLNSTTGDTVGFLERRTDQGPDMGLWASILSQARGPQLPAGTVPPVPTPAAGRPGMISGSPAPLNPRSMPQERTPVGPRSIAGNTPTSVLQRLRNRGIYASTRGVR